jgi:intracellular septation protein A
VTVGLPADAPDADAPDEWSRLAVFRAVVRRSRWHLIEATLLPTALFYCTLTIIGLGAAFVAAIAWTYAAVVCRLAMRRPIPPLLVLGVIGITVRTVLATASGSSFIYFLQPVLGGAVMGCVFLGSILVGRPLVSRLALEFWPLTTEQVEHVEVARLLRRLTYFWAGVNLTIAATTLLLLVSLPLATFVAIKQFVTLAITTVGVGVTIDRSIRVARIEGMSLRTPALATISA